MNSATLILASGCLLLTALPGTAKHLANPCARKPANDPDTNPVMKQKG